MDDAIIPSTRKELLDDVKTPRIDFEKIQRDKLRWAYLSGKQVEFESFSPYLQDYNTKTWEIWKDNLLNSDEAGIEIAKMIWRELPGNNVRQIMLYDEYNSLFSDSSDVHGKPKKYALDQNGMTSKENDGTEIEANQLEYSLEAKTQFKKNLETLLVQTWVINHWRKLLAISESEKIEDAKKFIQVMKERKSPDGQSYIQEMGKEILFVNPNAENPKYRKITLRKQNGHWMCEALDASSYIKPENLNITHLVILPTNFKEQQDKVWEMLRVLWIKPDNYHNIFFDPNMDPAEVTKVIKNEMLRNKPEL